MKYLLLTLLLSLPFIFTAQKVSPQVISNAGSVLENDQIKVSWTLGEFAIATIGTGPKLTQGKQQSKLLIETKVEDPLHKGKISLFPNPAQDLLNISIEEPTSSLKIQVFDPLGKLILQEDAFDKMQITLEKFSNGPYIVQIIDKNKVIYASAVIKL